MGGAEAAALHWLRTGEEAATKAVIAAGVDRVRDTLRLEAAGLSDCGACSGCADRGACIRVSNRRAARDGKQGARWAEEAGGLIGRRFEVCISGLFCLLRSISIFSFALRSPSITFFCVALPEMLLFLHCAASNAISVALRIYVCIHLTFTWVGSIAGLFLLSQTSLWSNRCVTGALSVQLDHKGQRVLAEVTRYDSRTARHEVQWRSDTGSKAGTNYKAWIDFCRDVVYRENAVTASGHAVRK